MTRSLLAVGLTVIVGAATVTGTGEAGLAQHQEHRLKTEVTGGNPVPGAHRGTPVTSSGAVVDVSGQTATAAPLPPETQTEPPAVLGGLATWYCGAGSPCTTGYGPMDLVAAIDPSLGIAKGERIRVYYGSRSVRVLVVDVCSCQGRRIVDLSRLAFSRLADPSVGAIPVSIEFGAQPGFTLPPTDAIR